MQMRKSVGSTINMAKGNIFSLVVLVCFVVFILIWHSRLVNRAVITKGKIYRYNMSGKGHMYIDYFFFVDGKEYKGSVPISFPLETRSSRSYQIGDSVVVRYERSNPSHNDLVP